MTSETHAPGRFEVTCECGEQFRVSPDQRGETIHCLACNRELLALTDEELAKMEEKRSFQREREIRGISLWIAIAGLLFGVEGVRYLLESQALLPVPGNLDPGLAGVLMMIAGILLLATGYYLRLHREEGRKALIAIVAAGLLTTVYFLGSGIISINIWSLGMIVWSIAALLTVMLPGGSRLFTGEYREMVYAKTPTLFAEFGSLHFWLPAALIGLSLII